MKDVIRLTKEQVEQAQKEVFKQTLTLINGALALVAALAWNEAVKSLIDKVFPEGSDVISKFIYALGITTFIVIFTRYLKKLENNPEGEKK